jgi:hypothetical protein
MPRKLYAVIITVFPALDFVVNRWAGTYAIVFWVTTLLASIVVCIGQAAIQFAQLSQTELE